MNAYAYSEYDKKQDSRHESYVEVDDQFTRDQIQKVAELQKDVSLLLAGNGILVGILVSLGVAWLKKRLFP